MTHFKLTESSCRLQPLAAGFRFQFYLLVDFISSSASRSGRFILLFHHSSTRHPRPGVFQAGSDSSPVSERPRTSVPVGLLRSGSRCRHSAAPAFHQPSTACSASLPAQHLRPSGLFSCRSQSLELSPRFHPRPDHHCRLFQTFA